ncbi:MAG: NADH dehydrogenase FAD-containing subunit [Candidatus Sericytochromatia bacterium]|nr:NADH dehydrogenase FAD-containing subunit [Candidatus Tanganyikabacteria bacterium]
MLNALILVPGLAGLLAFVIRADAPRRALLIAVGLANAGVAIACWAAPPGPELSGWLALDAVGRLICAITAAVFAMVAVYGAGYLAREGKGKRRDFEEDALFANAPEATFTGCLLLFLAAMNLMACSHHLGMLWIAMEATTLASAPLIYFHRHHRSLEASWKYLIICSVGIAIALLATFFLAIAASRPDGDTLPLIVGVLADHAGELNVPWLRAAFLLFLVGYGTKVGLAPLHTWLPDAHSEAPSVVSALLSGAVLNCAFLGILRVYQVCAAAGQGPFCQDLLRLFGLLSIGLAAVFILNQRDFKRMLAYSSIEHMGILALGVGLGGVAVFGALLHAAGHSLAKAMLFLASGNIVEVYRTKVTERVRGVLRAQPATGALWLAGFLAIAGFPPFSTFLSELLILQGAFETGRYAEGVAFLAGLAVVFAGMATAVLGMVQGLPAHPDSSTRTALLLEPIPAGRWFAVAPAAALGLGVLVLGLYLPAPVRAVLHEAAFALGGR